MLFTELLLKAVWRFFEIESDFVLWGSCILSDIIKIAKQINIYFAILVRWKGLSSKHTPWLRRNASICQQSLRMFLLSPQSQRLCGDPRNKEYSRTLSQHNKKVIRYKYLMTFLVRWKGLEPPTYWFVVIEKSLDYTILSHI